MVFRPTHDRVSFSRITGSSIGSGLLGQLDDAGKLSRITDLLTEGRYAALEGQRGHRDAPPVTGLTHHQVGVGAGIVEEDLVEFRVAGQLDDRADLDARLIERDEEIRQSGMPLGALLTAGDDEAPLRPMGQRRPHLLSVDDPVFAVELRGRRHVGEIAARARLRVPLAPQLGDVEDLGQEALLLLGGAVRDERRPDQLLTEVVDLVGRIGEGVLLVERDAVRHGQPSPAVLLRPPETRQPGRGEMLIPRAALVERLVLATRPSEALERGEFADEIVGEPLPDLGPELLDLYHPCRLTYQALALLEESRWTSQPRTIPGVLDRVTGEFSDHEALVTDDRTLTYAELRAEVRRAAAAMIDLGVNAGDRVAIWSPNTWHWVVACLATHYAGAVVVPLNTRYTASEATDILARTAAPLLIGMGRFLGSDKTAELDRAALPALRHVVRVPDRGRTTARLGRIRGARNRCGRRGRARRSRHPRRRLRHPLHLRHHRPQQGRALRAPAVPRRTRRLGRVRSAHQRRPLPLHQPVLPQLRLQGRNPGVPADGRDADPAADVRPREGDAGGAGPTDHRATRPADDLSDAARPPQARTTTT